jgi:NADPH-dependent 2,4-dienoyl-CoA reductase/sulfur reductase-like enzyme
VRLIIIGGVAAGTKAASRARRVDETAEITIYQGEHDLSISECGMPYALSGKIEKRQHLISRTPEDFAEKDIQALTGHYVERMDHENRTLYVKNLQTGETFQDQYDRLVIATGAEAIMPPITGAGLDGVFKLRFLTDLDLIQSYIQDHSPKKAVVVGGGYIGLEVAENLIEAGMEVAIVEAADQVAIAYGQEVADRVCDHLREKGIKLYTGDQVEECTGEDRVRGVRFGDREIEAGLVVVGIGVKPNVQLAEEAGVELGGTGAIKVDEHMKTNLTDVWAAGDCVETTNLASGRPAWVPLGDTANQMGRVAGTNAATGEDTLSFPGVLGTGIFKVFDLGVGKTGLSVGEAEEAGFEVVSAGIESNDKAGYYPGVEKVFLNLISDRESGRLLGAECAGSGADKLVEVCATAIWGRLTITDLINIDLAYAPPFSPTLSPVTQAATVLSGKL